MTTAKKLPQSNLRRLRLVRNALQKPLEINLLRDRMQELDKEFSAQTKLLAELTKDFTKKLTGKR